MLNNFHWNLDQLREIIKLSFMVASLVHTDHKQTKIHVDPSYKCDKL